jgi:sulfopropanediol 3-dehydrogenase
MVKYIKKGMSADKAQEADARVRGAVEGVLKDVAQRGDAAVRELSERYDRWSPPSFRLSPAQIKELIASLPEQTIQDIQFAQAQVRRFAQEQRKALQDIEVETLLGVILGHKNIPVNARRALSDGRFGAHERADGQGGRRAARGGLHTAHPGPGPCRHG